MVPEATIQWLDDLLGNIPIDPDSTYARRGQTKIRYVLWRMADVTISARQMPELVNTVTFPSFDELTPSRMVWTQRDGRVDDERPGGNLFFRDPLNLRELNVPLDEY